MPSWKKTSRNEMNILIYTLENMVWYEHIPIISKDIFRLSCKNSLYLTFTDKKYSFVQESEFSLEFDEMYFQGNNNLNILGFIIRTSKNAQVFFI